MMTQHVSKFWENEKYPFFCLRCCYRGVSSYDGCSLFDENMNKIVGDKNIPFPTPFKNRLDFVLTGCNNDHERDEDQNLTLDKLLTSRWEKAMHDGHFWYGLDHIKRREIEGSFRFIAQLNTKRFSERRKPSEMTHVKMPFNENKFNFTKVKPHEVLFRVNTKSSELQGQENLVIINVSPIDYGHVLLVPDATACLPQMITLDAMKLAIEMSLHSSSRSLRIGFNSLCAFASVNHLHFHMLYIDDELPLDRAKLSYCGAGLYELVDYCVRGFALQLMDSDTLLLALQVEKITSYLCENETPYNMFITRSRPSSCCNETSSTNSVENLKVFIFPKFSSPGLKDTKYMNSCCFDVAGYLLMKVVTDFSFNSAALELSGFLPIKDEKEFDEMTENQAVTILNKFALAEDEFLELKNKLTFLLENSSLNSQEHATPYNEER